MSIKARVLANSKDDPLASPGAKGERLKRIRHLANLSREECCHGSDINLTTLISWEVGRFGGLSTKGANKVIERVAKEGVFCTLEWLLYEIGAGPEVRADYKKLQHVNISIHKDDLPEKTKIVEELMLFKLLNKNAIDFIVQDDAMLPHYKSGDYVAGVKRFGDKIRSLLSHDCIVQIDDGRIVMRNLQAGPRPHSFNLVSTNLQTQVTDAIIFDVILACAAPIIWQRKKEPIL